MISAKNKQTNKQTRGALAGRSKINKNTNKQKYTII